MAIVLQDEIVDDMAKFIHGTCYFTLSTVEKYFTDRFYVNTDEQVLLFTTDTDVIRVNIGEGSNTMYVSDVPQEIGSTDPNYMAAFYDGDVLYIGADYVKKFANFEYYGFTEPNHVQVYTQWDEYTAARLSKKHLYGIRAVLRALFCRIFRQTRRSLFWRKWRTGLRSKPKAQLSGMLKISF